jgi:hypothetical protein
MAMCPECWNEKPYFAPRCTSCNQEIGFILQTVFQTVYVVVTLGLFYGMFKFIGWLISG